MGKLFILEGIPGSGKSTTAGWLAEELEKQGKNVQLFLEGAGDHPADYESVACLNIEQMRELESQFPETKSYATQKYDRFFIPYGSLSEKNNELFDALRRFDVYELSLEDFYEVTLMKWKEFADRARLEEEVYVLECCFLQNPFTFLLAKHNVSKEELFNHIKKIAEIIAVLNPTILYFEQDNIEDSLNRVRKERSQDWFEFLTWYYTEQAYGQARGLKGAAGVLHFLEERKQFEKEILKLVPIKSFLLNNSEYNWDERKREILEVLLEMTY